MRLLSLFTLLLLTAVPAFAEDLPLDMFDSLTNFERMVDTPELKAKAALGRKLYLDKNLSKDRDISCNSCHKLGSFGVDNLPTSPGHKGQLGDRNSPTTFNSALQFAQFWDGRAKNLVEQALGPMKNPVEMALADDEEIMKRIAEDQKYTKLFKKAFPDRENPVSINSIAEAIAFFEETLLTPGRFDELIDGRSRALTKKEKAGLKKFVEVGCTACHNGVLLGGNMFQKLGLVKPYKTEDTGRHKVTGKDSDKYFFKVPMLRNVEKTAPYFHDGSVKTLEEAVKLMGIHQLGKDLSEGDVQSIIAFLKTLTADIPENKK